MTTLRYPLRELPGRGPLLCDGAMGTLLYARGVPFDQCFDALDLTQRELVLNIHLDYLRAGAEMIETNTFGANPVKLVAHGLEDRARDINWYSAKIAKEARDIIGHGVFIAGSVGRASREARGAVRPHHTPGGPRRLPDADRRPGRRRRGCPHPGDLHGLHRTAGGRPRRAGSLRSPGHRSDEFHRGRPDAVRPRPGGGGGVARGPGRGRDGRQLQRRSGADADGAYFIPSFGRYEIVAILVCDVRSRIGTGAGKARQVAGDGS